MSTHLVWDWNGTLFHDLDAVVAATNELFAPYGLPALDADAFRAVYTRPVWLAYEKLLGRELREGEWKALDDGFHAGYFRLISACGLAEGAERLVKEWRGSQSICSMAPHAHLEPLVRSFGIDEYFLRVDGLRGQTGGEKAAHLTAHLAALSISPAETLLIGDSVDDGLAARQVGARAVLYTGGVNARSELELTGFPVVDTLAEALEHA